jgi:hypothetical protein
MARHEKQCSASRRSIPLAFCGEGLRTESYGAPAPPKNRGDPARLFENIIGGAAHPARHHRACPGDLAQFSLRPKRNGRVKPGHDNR